MSDILYRRVCYVHENDEWPGQYEYQKVGGCVVVVPPCLTCFESRGYSQDGHTPCPDCLGSGYHPDTIEMLAQVIYDTQTIFNGGKWPVGDFRMTEFRNQAVAVLDALTGDTE